jgi:hypothetical protein
MITEEQRSRLWRLLLSTPVLLFPFVPEWHDWTPERTAEMAWYAASLLVFVRVLEGK